MLATRVVRTTVLSVDIYMALNSCSYIFSDRFNLSDAEFMADLESSEEVLVASGPLHSFPGRGQQRI